MAKYVLSVAGRPGSLNEVVWAEGSFSHYKAYELESIDGFCMSFKDDAGIKAHLAEVMFSQKMNGEQTDTPNLKNTLAIRYMSRKVVKSLSYGLPYADDKKYFDYEYLRARLQSLRSDAVFLKRFAASFYGSPIQASNLAVIKEAATLLEKGIPLYDKLEDRFYTAMQDFIMVELFKYDREAHDYKTNKDGSLIVQWRRLHDLAMFVINYDRKNTDSKPKEEIVTPEPFVKTLEQEKIVYQQLSLFD